jgi:hypothetical protein
MAGIYIIYLFVTNVEIHTLSFFEKHDLARNARHLADSAGVLLKNNISSE